MTQYLYTLPRTPGVGVGPKQHTCGEHPDGYPGACGKTYWSPAGGLELAGPCCKATDGFKQWARERKRQQDARHNARKGRR